MNGGMMDTNEKRIEEESARALIGEINAFARTSPLNRMPGDEEIRIFDTPLVKFADGDDPCFTELKDIISPAHMTPREVLAKAYDKQPDELPARVSVISWILPITEKTLKSNRPESTVPSRFWSHTRWFGEQFNDALREYVADILIETGYMAVAPATRPYLEMGSDEKGPYSNWSERHIAYVAGQGTFSLSDGFITEKGIAHRCGSVVTDMPLPANTRTVEGPYDNCLFYFDGSCKLCVDRCPAEAISEAGHDKKKCQKYLNDIGYTPAVYKYGYDLEKSVAGCGLCQTATPCEHRVPLKIQRSRKT
jgi:epoxyqueuosine reductase